MLKDKVRERVYNVGRLDYDSSGLLLFTNDGDFAGRVGHPSGGIEKEYLVRTDKEIPESFLKAFLRGIPDAGQILRAVTIVRESARSVRIVLVEGRNREIRRALTAFGLSTTHLARVRIGPVGIEASRWGSSETLRTASVGAFSTGEPCQKAKKAIRHRMLTEVTANGDF
jgi:23S rRNA pseudouridine2605 synthase